MPARSGLGGGGLFGSTNTLLGKQLGSLASLSSLGTLSSLSTPQRFDFGLTSTLMDPTQPQIGGLSKLAGSSFGPGEFDPMTGSFGSPQKIRGADIGTTPGSGLAPLPNQPGMPGSSGAIGSLGGEYSVLDQYDQFFQQAAAATGVPVNLLKAVAAVERGWEGPSVSGAVGIMQIMPGIWGHLGDIYSPQGNILAGAKILQSNYQQYGDWDTAVRAYLGFGTDAYGTSDSAYLQRVKQFQRQLDASGGSFGGGYTVSPTVPDVGSPGGNRVLQEAVKYVGVQYVWGGIPEANQDPWQTGWDCSGFTYFLDQKYGSGQLPRGSHYQYDYALRTGRLNTDPSALQPGDLVFFDTGWYGGAGGNLNPAGHVGVYLGNDQFIHAANPSQGTIISQFSTYTGGRFLGGMRSAFSGGGAVGGFGATGGAATGGSGGGVASGPLAILQRIRGY